MRKAHTPVAWLSGKRACATTGRQLLQVGRADGRCFKPGNPSNALLPQPTGELRSAPLTGTPTPEQA
ncbi:MAG: hypothetical protein KME46_30055 [Brasilonema angustatum HA4187-MV1]|nr:hypothetical protein [Brasilonema angustatum HA4187-MV1]